MIKYLLLIIIFLAGCGQYTFGGSDNESRIGIATYALLNPSYPVAELLSALEDEEVYRVDTSFVAGRVFGTDYDNFRELAAAVEVPQAVVYLAWAGCVSDQDCQSGVVLDGVGSQSYTHLLDQGWFLARYQQALADILPLIQEYPEIDWIVFPELESSLSPVDHDRLVGALSILGAGISQIRVGYNPLTLESSKGTAQLYEGHRQTGVPQPCISNNDGVSINLFGENFGSGEGPSWSVPQVKDYFNTANCETNYVWHHKLSNCITPGQGTASRDRICGGSTEQFRTLIREFKY